MTIAHLTNADFGISIPPPKPNLTIRHAARGLIFNDENQIAILYKREMNQYKLIGGGVERERERERERKREETAEQAFHREAKEESGCIITIEEYLGITIEERNSNNFIQISEIFVAKATEFGATEYTERETAEGSELIWLEIDDALSKIKDNFDKLKDSPYKTGETVYSSKFVSLRDIKILEYYLSTHT